MNVSNGNSKSEEFNLNNIEVLVDSEEQNLFKRAHVGKILGLVHIHRSTARLADEDQKIQAVLQVEGGCHNATSPREDAQDHDIFISLTGTLYVIVNSRENKSKVLKEHILKDIVPRGFKARIKGIQEEHQQAITGRDNQIQAREFRNEVHQQEILRLNEEIDDLIKNRHMARRGCFDNVLCFIKKNSKEIHPYYVIRCQYRQVKNIRNGLNFVTQTWRWLTNGMIQMPFTDGLPCGSAGATLQT